MVSIVTASSARMSIEEWQTRCDLAACYRLVDLFGWSDLNKTHITARVPGREDHFLINRYGLLFDRNYSVDACQDRSRGQPGRAVGIRGQQRRLCDPERDTHGAAEIACLLHTHSIAGCAVSMQKGGLLPLNQHALQVIGDVAYHSYEGAARSFEERQHLLADFGDRHIMVLRNHRLLVVGSSIAAAFVATYRMERACAMQLAFQQSRAEFNSLPDDIVCAAYANGFARRAVAAMILRRSNGPHCCVSSTASTRPTNNEGQVPLRPYPRSASARSLGQPRRFRGDDRRSYPAPAAAVTDRVFPFTEAKDAYHAS